MKSGYVSVPQVSVKVAGEEGAALYHPDTGKTRSINATGLFIWERLDGSHSVDDIVREMREHFEGVSDGANEDVRSFLNSLVEEGFVSATVERGERFKPPYPSLGDGPETVSIAITGRCNLKCAHCFYADEMVARSDLPTERWLVFLDELGGLAVQSITLTGGEAFTRPDLWELIDSIIANRMRYDFLTNGTLITEKTLEAFSMGKRRQRLNSIQISIDGSCPEVHDRFRGPGAFDKALKGLRLLKEAGFPVTVRVTVNRYNLDDLEDVSRLLLEDVGIGAFSTNDAMPMGSGCQNRESIALTLQEQRRAMEILVGLSERYNGRVAAMAGPLAKAKSFAEMERARATEEKTSRWHMGYLTSCGGVFNKLDVLHDGGIVPCHMLHRLVMGKVGEDPVKEIWRDHPTLVALRERRKIPMNQVPGCEDCEWAPYCNGGCPGLAHELTGDFNRANPWDCYKRFVEEAGRWLPEKITL
jgi:SynChlorMet cassette radical SAM/SPASM protein ScmE